MKKKKNEGFSFLFFAGKTLSEGEGEKGAKLGEEKGKKRRRPTSF